MVNEVKQFVRNYAIEDRPLKWSEMKAAIAKCWPSFPPPVVECLVWAVIEGVQLGILISPSMLNDAEKGMGATSQARHLYSQLIRGMLDNVHDCLSETDLAESQTSDKDPASVLPDFSASDGADEHLNGSSTAEQHLAQADSTLIKIETQSDYYQPKSNQRIWVTDQTTFKLLTRVLPQVP